MRVIWCLSAACVDEPRHQISGRQRREAAVQAGKTVVARDHVNRRTSEQRVNVFTISSEKEEKAAGLKREGPTSVA